MSALTRIRFAALALALAAATSLCAQQTHVQDPARSKELNTQAYIQLLRADLSAKKEQIVRETMQLNDQQAAIFWPIYRVYQAEQSKLGADKLAVVADYSQNFSAMTDQNADQLAQRLIQLDEKRMALREKYYGIMKKSLSPTIALRFFQVEHQLQQIVDLQIAMNLPIIEENDSN
jgi:hypothetical protein